MKTKDLPTKPILDYLKNSAPCASIWDLMATVMPGIHGKLCRSKIKSLIRQELITGCACGCRGDLTITNKGRALLSTHVIHAKLENLLTRHGSFPWRYTSSPAITGAPEPTPVTQHVFWKPLGYPAYLTTESAVKQSGAKREFDGIRAGSNGERYIQWKQVNIGDDELGDELARVQGNVMTISKAKFDEWCERGIISIDDLVGLQGHVSRTVRVRGLHRVDEERDLAAAAVLLRKLPKGQVVNIWREDDGRLYTWVAHRGRWMLAADAVPKKPE
jgi:hypothetical protein